MKVLIIIASLLSFNALASDSLGKCRMVDNLIRLSVDKEVREIRVDEGSNYISLTIDLALEQVLFFNTCYSGVTTIVETTQTEKIYKAKCGGKLDPVEAAATLILDRETEVVKSIKGIVKVAKYSTPKLHSGFIKEVSSKLECNN